MDPYGALSLSQTSLHSPVSINDTALYTDPGDPSFVYSNVSGTQTLSDRIHDLYVISGDDRKVPEHFEVQVPIQLNSSPIQSSTTHTNVDLNAARTDALADLRRELRTLPSDKNILQHFGGQKSNQIKSNQINPLLTWSARLAKKLVYRCATK